MNLNSDFTNLYGNKFNNWFNNTLKINCPYIFFGSKNSLQIIKSYRKKKGEMKCVIVNGTGLGLKV